MNEQSIDNHGMSQPMVGAHLKKNIGRKIKSYSRLSEPVLILGESGTGKELVAQRFKENGQSYIPINCAKYNGQDGLLESELFGHVKGAFTGAIQDHKGIFEVVNGGVIFLDEVHTLSLSSQQKLLRVLQEKKYRRVGENRDREFLSEFRIIAAAKDGLYSKMEAGEFLPDFFFRINTFTIRLKPLRQRTEDFSELCCHFLDEIKISFGLQKKISPRALEEMKKYSWPGNIRELRNALIKMAVDSRGPQIQALDFQGYLHQLHSDCSPDLSLAHHLDYRSFIQRMERGYFRSQMSVSESREDLIKKTGISRSTLYRKLADLGLSHLHENVG